MFSEGLGVSGIGPHLRGRVVGTDPKRLEGVGVLPLSLSSSQSPEGSHLSLGPYSTYRISWGLFLRIPVGG